MLRVYIASAITQGDLAENVNRAVAAGVDLMTRGFAPIIPHLTVFTARPCSRVTSLRDAHEPQTVMAVGTAAGHDSVPYQTWIAVGRAHVAGCHAVLRLPGHSPGADEECGEAARLGLPVFTKVEDLVAWSKTAVPVDLNGLAPAAALEVVKKAVGYEEPVNG